MPVKPDDKINAFERRAVRGQINYRRSTPREWTAREKKIHPSNGYNLNVSSLAVSINNYTTEPTPTATLTIVWKGEIDNFPLDNPCILVSYKFPVKWRLKDDHEGANLAAH